MTVKVIVANVPLPLFGVSEPESEIFTHTKPAVSSASSLAIETLGGGGKKDPCSTCTTSKSVVL